MVEIPCPVCGSEKREKLLTGGDYICASPLEFTLVTCGECGLVYLCPRPEAADLEAHYGNEYREWQSPPASGLASRFRVLGVRRKVRAVAEAGGRGRLLDVGCGYGDFLQGAREAGFEVSGTELESEQARRASELSGADVRAGGLEECSFETSSFDVITLWHVLEHLPDPVGTLTIARELLKPGGTIVVGVPDSGSWAARLFGPYWAGYDMPRHLCDFSAATLEDALRRAGFAARSRSYFMGTYDNVRISLEFLIKDRVPEGQMKSILLRLIGGPLARLVLTGPTIALQVLGRGTVVTCFANRAVA